MARKELTELQYKVLAEIAKGEKNITEICSEFGVGRTTYYDWRKTDLWKVELANMLEVKKQAEIDGVKNSVDIYLKRLEDLSKKSKNDMVRYQATKELLGHAGMVVSHKEEVTVKQEDDEQKNVLLNLLNKKKQDREDQVH